MRRSLVIAPALRTRRAALAQFLDNVYSVPLVIDGSRIGGGVHGNAPALPRHHTEIDAPWLTDALRMS